MSIEPFYMLRMQAYEARALTELASEQVTHVDLAEYQPGTPHYEALQAAMQTAQRYHWPSEWRVNL